MPAVDLPIIGALVHPPIGLLSLTLEGVHGPGGSGSLTPPQGPLALTYGLYVSIFTAPAGWGFKLGSPNIYEPAFLQLSSTYQDLAASHDITLQTELIAIDGFSYFWQESLPFSVNYYIQPGWTLTFRWLQT